MRLNYCLLCLLTALGVCLPGFSLGEPEIGVIVMAHGGARAWNKTVKQTVQSAEIPYPTKIFYGMADNRDEIDRLQNLVRALEDKGVHTIVVVPLLVSSYSEVARQWKYLFGVSVSPGFINNPAFPLEHNATIRYAEPLNDDPIAAEILMERAQELSHAPNQETVLLVAHGPNDDTDNAHWLETLRRLAENIRQRAHFKSVEGFTLRDDAPLELRSQAARLLRERVEAVNREGGRAIIVPLLLAPGGIENKIATELKGLGYAFNARTLLPDRRISEWIRSRVP